MTVTSSQHFLIQIVKEHLTLKSLVSTDAGGRGTLIMGKEQFKELRCHSNMKLRFEGC